MKLGCVLACATIAIATARLAYAAPEAVVNEKARRVVVAGPQDDVIAPRVQKELTALGFESVRVGALEGCARSAVVVAALENEAVAAVCSDGEQVGIWIAEGTGLRLRDVVVAREETDRERETTAVRAAEVTRASIALRDAEGDAPPAAPAPAAPPPPAAIPIDRGEKEAVDRADPKPVPRAVVERRTALLTASAGASALMGVDATVGAVSGQLTVGAFEHFSIAARLEFPFEDARVFSDRANLVHVAPGLAGAGLEFPLFRPSSFVIPRFGGGLGVAWLSATKRGVDSFSNGTPADITFEGTDTIASPAGYLTAGASMRVIGPVRLLADAVFGTTLSRFVARDAGEEVAFWGQPLASLALRAEVLVR